MNAATTAADPTILHATGLRKTYRVGGRDLNVLRGVDMDLKRGEWVAILGASGSGKSTLLHLLGALDRPSDGAVRFEEQPIYQLRGQRLDRYRNQHVGFVFQFYHLLPELSAEQNVLLGAMVGKGMFAWLSERNDKRQRARKLLETMGLGERLTHKPNKLSGGERQRVAIARALINQPQILLADEPTGNLDAETGSQILDVLQTFHDQGQTIVMVTHDANVATRADRQLTLKKGQLA